MVAGDRASAAVVLRQARQRGITLPVMGGDALSGIQSEGAVAEGVYLTSNYFFFFAAPLVFALALGRGFAFGL